MANVTYRGNTLTEYALLFGLVAVGCMGAMSLAGNSLFSLHNTIAFHITNTAPGGDSAQNTGNAAAWAAGGVETDSASTSSVKAMNTGKFATLDAKTDGSTMSQDWAPGTFSGSSGNATGSNGDNMILGATYAQTIAAAFQLAELAATTTEPNLKAWYESAARNTMMLAKNQAAYDYNDDTSKKEIEAFVAFVGSNNVAANTAVKSMDVSRSSLEEQKATLQNNPTIASAGSVQTAIGLVDHILQINNAQYSDVLKYTDVSQAQVYTPDVSNIRKDATAAIQAGIATNSPALQSSINTSLEMKNRADALP